MTIDQRSAQLEQRLCTSGRMEKILRMFSSQGLGSVVASEPCYFSAQSRIPLTSLFVHGPIGPVTDDTPKSFLVKATFADHSYC